MKKIINVIFIAIGLLILALFAVRYYTKSHSEFESIQGKTGELVVKVGYSRPLVRNRKIFGGLVPYNTVWRTGANEATTISFSNSCMVNDKKVKAGDYTLWTIPGVKSWVIILNHETGQWGTNYDPSRDYIRFEVKTETQKTITEKFTIEFEKPKTELLMLISWENTKIKIPIKEK